MLFVGARDVRRRSSTSRSTCRTCSATRRSRPARAFLPMTLLIILLAPQAGGSPTASARAGSSAAACRCSPARSSTTRALGAQRELLGAAARPAARRRRHGADDDARDRGRDGLGARSTRPGVGSAVLNSSRQVGGSLGIASWARSSPRGSVGARDRRPAAGRLRARLPRRARASARCSRSPAPSSRCATIRKVEHRRARAPRRAVEAGVTDVSPTRPRLTAEERRQAVLDDRLPRLLASRATAARRPRRSPARPGSASRSSTATSARSATSTSPASTRRGATLPRRVASRRSPTTPAGCLGAIADALHGEGQAPARSSTCGSRRSPRPPDDRVIAAALRTQMREVHDFFADADPRRPATRASCIADRDPVAEAWLFVAGGLLATMDHRLGGLLGDDLAARPRVAPRLDDRRRRLVAQKKEGPRLRLPRLIWAAPAAAPGVLPGQAGRRLGVPKSRLCGPARLSGFVASGAPPALDSGVGSVQGALTLGAIPAAVK